MLTSQLMVRASSLALLALLPLSATFVSEVSCSGKEGTCEVANCGAVQPVDLGFTCEGYGVPPYATIRQTTLTGPCAFSCVSPTEAGGCALLELDPTGAGVCHVEVTSSAGAVFPLTYTWVSTPVAVSGHVCPGCFTLDLADGGPSPSPFARACDGGVEESGSDGGVDGG
jgi:hypothetical protein